MTARKLRQRVKLISVSASCAVTKARDISSKKKSLAPVWRKSDSGLVEVWRNSGESLVTDPFVSF